MARELVKKATFRPFGKKGAAYTVTLFRTRKEDWRGSRELEYKLTRKEHGVSQTVFEGGEFFPPPHRPHDSDKNIRDLMDFILFPPYIKRSYFRSYSEEQIKFLEEEGEHLKMEIMDRIGED